MKHIAAAFAHGLHALAQRLAHSCGGRRGSEALSCQRDRHHRSARRCILASETAILAAARELGAAPEAPVPGRTERVDLHFSALATGFAGHLDDFDDTHLANRGFIRPRRCLRC